MNVFAKHLQNFDFIRLFNELGWDQLRVGLEKEAGGCLYTLQPVAIKKGVQVLRCTPGEDGLIPPYAVRQKIERKVTADAREHLIIFTDAAQTRQIWQWVARAPGRPTQYREVKWQQGQATDLLEQKLKAIAFDLDEEESLTVFGVAERLRGGFDRDNVTKKFYKVFQAQREAFQRFIDGIPSDDNARWYTAVVIDRLMFLWFLQEKFFLNGEKRYLRNRLDAHLVAATGNSFYKAFLCPLFFCGFAEERTETNRAAIQADFGNVPYLNGGLFAEHELERQYGDAIDIPDNAFAALFEFFDQWDWHLDERPLASGKEVNPDVLGYIFEKFVNQKQMGAYYTKEDITEYIAKNTIIPCLFDKVRTDHVAAFDAYVWPLLQEDPRRYLYPAMLHGVDETYPPEIGAGLDTETPDLLERRKPWNRQAAPSHALPTEIWRETIARHQRTREVLAKLEAGEVRTVADLVTYNLNIRQFAQDVIERCSDPTLLRAFWVALAGRVPRRSNEKLRHGISVLDPTCGSGAFLFAALQILKPLYQACLTAMSGLLVDAYINPNPAEPNPSPALPLTREGANPSKPPLDRGGFSSPPLSRGARGVALQDFEEVVDRFQAHGTDRQCDYAVLKHIIVNNLYGVDIEAQATEIAKLRLFLKLVALLEPGDEIEPLPDIDFNIRAGNTLVGYASAAETERAVHGAEQVNLFTDAWDDIRIRLVAVEQAYNNFQIQQVQRGGHVTAEDKRALGDQLGELEETLNGHLCREYGKDPKKVKEYKAWKESHKPFHWYVDFYPIMAAGGFDVVIGNPPYIELHKIKEYAPKESVYSTISCGNLYAPMLERDLVLTRSNGRLGQIVPISCVSTNRMQPLRDLWANHQTSTWLSHYSGDAHPSVLFNGVKFRLSIVLQAVRSGRERELYTSGFQRWFPEARDNLFEAIEYSKLDSEVRLGLIPKMDNKGLKCISTISQTNKLLGGRLMSSSAHVAYAHRIVAHYVKAFDFAPYFRSERDGEKRSEDYKPFAFATPDEVLAFTGILNSSIFYIWFVAYSDIYHCGRELILDFPFDFSTALGNRAFLEAATQLMSAYRQTAVRRRIPYEKTGIVEYDEFYPRKVKEDVDVVDVKLAKLFALDHEQLDYIINYDIKYRMGLNGEEADSND